MVWNLRKKLVRLRLFLIDFMVLCEVSSDVYVTICHFKYNGSLEFHRLGDINGPICFCKCNGKYYVVYSDDVKPIVAKSGVISFFNKFVEVYFFCTSFFEKCSKLFYNCHNLELVHFSSNCVCECRDCQDMFYGCNRLKAVYIGSRFTGDLEAYLNSIGFYFNSDKLGWFEK